MLLFEWQWQICTDNYVSLTKSPCFWLVESFRFHKLSGMSDLCWGSCKYLNSPWEQWPFPLGVLAFFWCNREAKEGKESTFTEAAERRCSSGAGLPALTPRWAWLGAGPGVGSGRALAVSGTVGTFSSSACREGKERGSCSQGDREPGRGDHQGKYPVCFVLPPVYSTALWSSRLCQASNLLECTVFLPRTSISA